MCCGEFRRTHLALAWSTGRASRPFWLKAQDSCGGGMLMVAGGIPAVLVGIYLRAFFADIINRPPKARALRNFHYRKAADPDAFRIGTESDCSRPSSNNDTVSPSSVLSTPGRCRCIVERVDAEALPQFDGTPWTEVLITFEKRPLIRIDTASDCSRPTPIFDTVSPSSVRSLRFSLS